MLIKLHAAHRFFGGLEHRSARREFVVAPADRQLAPEQFPLVSAVGNVSSAAMDEHDWLNL